jgi:hypothetical protein
MRVMPKRFFKEFTRDLWKYLTSWMKRVDSHRNSDIPLIFPNTDKINNLENSGELR